MDALINLQGEQELLGCLLSDNTLFDYIADIVESHDFAEPVHERIFDAALSEVMSGKSANPVTLQPFFVNDPAVKQLGGAAYMMELTGMAAYADPVEVAKHLRELSQRRHMRDGLNAAAERCNDVAVGAVDIIDIADGALSARAKDFIHQPSGGYCFDELLESFDQPVVGVKCGKIDVVDELLGPIRPKQLIIGAGRPGMGKTAFALSYSVGAAQNGHGVLFVSLEMSSTELASRMAADLCYLSGVDVPFNVIRDNRLTQQQKQKVRDAGSYMRGLPFNVIDAGSLTIGRLSMLVRRHARRMAAQGHKLELVVIDYLQLLSPDGRGKSTYEAVSEVSRGLKALAKDNGVGVLALAQLSRTVETRTDKTPMLSDLRDSGQIEQDADAVLFLLRDEYYLRAEEPDQMHPKRAEWEAKMAQCEGKIEFIVAKRRNGTTGKNIGSFAGKYQAVRS